MKGILGILLFVFFLIVFILMLTGSYIIRALKKAYKNAQDAAEKKEQRFRDEVGRQRQQYSQRQQPTGSQSAQSNQTTQTETGETIIDQHREKRENRKIFDDADGEYVEFEET